MSPELVTGGNYVFSYLNYVLTVVCEGAAEENLVLNVPCVGEAGFKNPAFLFIGL